MENYFLFMTLFNFCLIINVGQVSATEEIEECSEGILKFYKIGNTNGNYVEVIFRAGQFVTLQDDNLSIYDNRKIIIYSKKIETSGSRLSLDIFKNILFINHDRLGIYIPDNDEIFMKKTILWFSELEESVVFDRNNTIYAIINNKINFVRHVDDTFGTLPRLADFGNVTYLVQDDNGTFYFAYKRNKTSWIVNGKTQQIMFQTSLIKNMIFARDPLVPSNGHLYFIDEKCALKALKVIPTFNVYEPELTKIMEFADCEYRYNDKYVFSYEGEASGKETYVFNKNKIYGFRIGNESVCLRAELESNIIINAAAVNFNYIMLATSDGLWVTEWKY